MGAPVLLTSSDLLECDKESSNAIEPIAIKDRGMLSLRKLDGVEGIKCLPLMHRWMQAQPKFYNRNYGFNRLRDILNPDIPINYYGFFQGDSLIAVVSLVLESKGVCHFGLTCPPRPRFRAIIPLIEEFRRAFFDEYGGLLLYISVPPDTHPISHRLAAMLGCQRVSAERWEYSLFHHLQELEQNGIKRPESL